jgi:hypothetical protein
MLHARQIPSVLIALAGAAAASNGQVINWGAVQNGLWSAPANWSPANVPDSAAESAVLGLAGGYTVDLNVSATIAELHLTNPDAVLSMGAGRTLHLTGPSATNNGLIMINPANSGSDVILALDSDVDLTGSGEIWLRTNNENSQIVGPGLLTNGPAHAVRGVGYLRAPTDNQGLILADISVGFGGYPLQAFEGPFTNSGTMGAEAGSVLEITATTVTQSGGELWASDGGAEVRLGNGATIVGGELNADGDGLFRTIGSPTLEDVTGNATVLLIGGNTLTVTGAGLTNNGLLRVNPANSGADAAVHFPASGTLAGTGEIWLQTNNENSRLTAGIGAVVHQGESHSVRGVGYLSAGLVNDGLVAADASVAVSGDQLHVFGEGKVNNGVMLATTGSKMEITSTTIDQTGGGELRADAGGQIRPGAGAVLRGGQFAGPGTMITTGACTLESLTLNGDSVVSPGSSVSITGAGLVNNGIVSVNPNNSGADAIVRFEQSGALDGTGEIRLMTNAENSRLETGAGAVITQSAGHTVRGVGHVPAAMVNGGLVLADVSVAVSGNTLYLFGGPKTNDGVMAAAAGSVLQLSDTTIINTGELVALDGAGLVTLGNGLTVIGGELNAEGDGSFGTVGSPTLEGVVSNAPFSLNAGHTVSVTGSGLTNNGVVRVNSQNSGADTFLHFPASATLGGSGEVWLRTNAENSRVTAAAGEVVTHGASHTIRGVGYVNAGMINNGHLAADMSVAVSGNIMYIFGDPKANNGLMSAEAGSFLDITATTIDQSGGGVLRAEAGGQVRLGGDAVLSGGLIAGDGMLSTIGACTLDGVTIDTDSAVNAGHAVTVTGGLVNNGSCVLNPQNSGADSVLSFPADATIGGAGEIVLFTGSENARFSGAGTVTQGPDHTLRGIGNVNVNLVNQGRIEPGNSVGTMGFGANLDFAATSVLGIEVDGLGSFDRIAAAGLIAPGGVVVVEVGNGFKPLYGQTFQIISAGAVDGEFDDVLFDPMKGGRIFVLDYSATAVTLRVDLGCVADWNIDGSINTLDFLSYLNDWTAGDLIADLTGNGSVDTQDFLAFLNNWTGGC